MTIRNPTTLAARLVCCLLPIVTLAGCIQQAPERLTLHPATLPEQVKPEAVHLLPNAMNQADRIIASETTGLWVLTSEGQVFAHQSGQIESVDFRVHQTRVLMAAYDKALHQVVLHGLDTATRQWSAAATFDAGKTAVEALCLFQDADELLFLFLLGEEGRAQQWLVGERGQWLARPQPVRSLSIPAASEACAVDDRAQRLLVSEEGVGVWSYPASPEAESHRQPVAMQKPFGDLSESVTGMAIVDSGVWLLQGEAGAVQYYRYNDENAAWQMVQHNRLATTAEVEGLSVRRNQNGVELLLSDPSKTFAGHLAVPAFNPVDALSTPPVSIPAALETQPVEHPGDAADDPAIWIHPTTPSLSRIIGTNKQQGLLVYDLDGHLRQSLPVGRLNNVDVRGDIALGSKRVDVAVASHRDHNSLYLFTINRENGELTAAGEIATPLSDIYGVCLYQPSPGSLYAFANGKDGRFLQYHIESATGTLHGKLVREFTLKSQPEGCVADDAAHQLYMGEETVGVWVVDARADRPAAPAKVISVGDVLKADVEGLALHHNAEHNWLIISSQGNDSYVVVEATAPYALVGRFRIGLNVDAGIDGASETDGLDVTSANLGAPWTRGMLVVQDGRNRMPEQPQNFKLVPWMVIEPVLLPAKTTQGE